MRALPITPSVPAARPCRQTEDSCARAAPRQVWKCKEEAGEKKPLERGNDGGEQGEGTTLVV